MSTATARAYSVEFFELIRSSMISDCSQQAGRGSVRKIPKGGQNHILGVGEGGAVCIVISIQF